jgi:hypothetical protein
MYRIQLTFGQYLEHDNRWALIYNARDNLIRRIDDATHLVVAA